MKIIVRATEDSRKIRLWIPVPLSIINWNLVWKFVPEEAKQYRTIAESALREIRKYKRICGSFNLVEVIQEDTYVLIRI